MIVQPPPLPGSAVLNPADEVQIGPQHRYAEPDIFSRSLSQQQSESLGSNETQVTLQVATRVHESTPVTLESADHDGRESKSRMQPLQPIREEWTLQAQGYRARILPTMTLERAPERPAPVVVQPPPLPGCFPGYG